MIEKLTKTQESLLSVYRDKWRNIGLCTEPADRPMAEKGIELTYKVLKKGFTIKEVPIIFTERKGGQSKFNFRIVIESFIKVIQLRFKR